MKKAAPPLRASGFTLFEALIAGAVTVILLGIIFSFLTRTSRGAALGAMRADMQQAAQRTMITLAKDLEVTAANGISLSTGGTDGYPVMLGIVPIKDVMDDGTPQWSDELIVYSWSSPGSPLVRKDWKTNCQPSVTEPLTMNQIEPLRVSANTLAIIANEGRLQGQNIAAGVTAFTVTHTGLDPSVSAPITVTIRMERQGNTGRPKPESYELSATLSVKNR